MRPEREGTRRTQHCRHAALCPPGRASEQPSATAQFEHHDVPLWLVDSPDRAVFAGEAQACWLWLVMWPETAGTLLIEPIELRDLRDPLRDLDLPYGAPSVRLPGKLAGFAPIFMSTATSPTGPMIRRR
jgi:hypothetical protein